MKYFLSILIIASGASMFAQKTVKTTTKPKSIDEVYKGKHTLVSAKKDPKYGWDLHLKLSSNYNEDSIRCFEVLRADSSLYYAFILWNESQHFTKGQELKRLVEITGDSIRKTDRFAPIGTYKDFYPKDSLAEGKASIMFLDAIVPNSKVPGYFLPDFEVTQGSFSVGDVIEITDERGKKCQAKIEVLEIGCDAYGASSKLTIQYLIPEFTIPEKFKSFMIYSKISGNDVGENLKIKKVH